MKKVYIDVTQSYAWRGKVTGIQRVINEISRRFVGNQRFSPVFIICDKNTATFREVDFIQVLLDQERVESASSMASPHVERTFSSKARVKALLKRVYHRVPAARAAYNIYSSFNGRLVKRLTPGTAVEIERKSLLFMPHGGVWESETYMAEVLELKSKKSVKLITVLYDLIPVLAPQFAVEAIRQVYEHYMKQVLPKSDLILAISKNTASDAHDWLRAIGENSPANIKVIRLGDEIGREDPVRPEHITLPKEYILCVGTIEARKNHTSLYFAYKLAAQEKQHLPTCLVVGRLGWMSGDIYQIITSDPDTKDRIIFLRNISDDQLAWLYKHALLSVYPSFYEGWGLPIAESLLHGTPCLASETSSIKEIAGNLVDYFSPYAPEQLKQKIEKYSTNPSLLRQRRAEVRKKYKATSWDKTYSQVADFLEDIAD